MTSNIQTALSELRTAPPGNLGRAVGLGLGWVPGFSTYEAPVGEVAVVFTPSGVKSVRLLDEVEPLAVEAKPPRAWASLIGRAIERGTPGDLPLDLTVTPFRRRVLDIAGSIPRGEVRSYGWLARHVGKPGAARAVGSAMATNPVPLIVPCHRVVRSDGHIGAYSLGGAHNKWTLLRHEGAGPDDLEAMAESGIRYLASTATGIFCVPSCSRARALPDADRIGIRSDAAAERAGLTPCELCRPLG